MDVAEKSYGYLTEESFHALSDGCQPLDVGAAELFDRLTIVALKVEHCLDKTRRARLRAEAEYLASLIGIRGLPKEVPFDWEKMSLQGLERLAARLQETNRALWKVEDGLRALDAAVFDDLRVDAPLQRKHMDYMRLARRVYVLNRQRLDAKAAISTLFGELPEYKVYAVDVSE